ncbi:uncharacterized protein H6S33_001355 [Morchella sextelata]|uniref:uncharacterized protein n=1 Tax=Morchella sextelata TaxID=1174677 RepID=UPI001D043DA8|nr:uncharacterized protein H6S33_001355 [Morchella sextelata]KAH0609127.1 hypothetical protein H6S33_001355 [Morchella sextelata]
MNSDSDESSYEDDSPPNFAFSPDFSVRASPIVNGGGGRGKRKVGLPSRYHQVLSARGSGGGGCLDAAGEIYSEHPRKRRKGPQTNTPDNSTSTSSSSDRSFACPYYKNDPVKHSSCAEWNKKDIHRVKEHIKRSHLKPIQCPRCSVYRAGDNGQINIHLRDGECQKAKTVSLVESDVLKKAKALERRNLNWQHIYQILFGCAESDIPSPIWQSHITPPTPPTIKLESSPLLGAYCTDMFEAHLNEELNDFIEYFQEQVPRLVRELFREYQALKFKAECPLSGGGTGSVCNQSSAPPYPGASATHHNNNININTTDYEQGPRKPKTVAKNSPKEQRRTEEAARKPTENVVRKKQNACPDVASSPKQRPDARKIATDEKQTQRGDLLSKADEAGQKRHTPVSPLTPSTHQQQQQQPNITNPTTPQEKVFANRNEAPRMHDIPSPYIQLQHNTLNQSFASLHDGTSRGIIPDHAARILHEPRVTDDNSSPVVGFGDLALNNARDDASGEVEEVGSCDPAMLWVLDAYDWRF